MRRLYELLFPGHPYGRPVLGTPDGIRALSRETLATFYRRHYVPEAFALVVVGAVDRQEMLQAARATFGLMPRSGLGRLPAPALPESLAHREEIGAARCAGAPRPGVAGPTPGSRRHAGGLPPRDHAGGSAFLAPGLGCPRPRRAGQRDIGAAFSALEAAGMVSVSAQLAPANLAAAETAILAEVRRIRDDEGVTSAELHRAVKVTEARHAFSIETAEGRARALGHAETVWRIEDELAYRSRVRSVTREQVRAVARRYLDPERYVRLALLPPSR